MKSAGLLASLIFFLAISAQAALRVPQVFSDHMVLQRDLPIEVWGWADAKTSVTVDFAGQKKTAIADANGKWKLTLDKLPASFSPREMVISSAGSETLTIKDILVGEVWFTAGQSNMMMGLSSATGGDKYYDEHLHDGIDKIRVVNQMRPPGDHLKEADDVAAAWGPPTKTYSAVSLWFAHKLFQHFKGEVPVGMITYTVITPAEGWIKREILEADPRLRPVLTDSLQQAALSYNGIIAAIAPYSIRGVIYYQAEYNGGRGLQFRAMMPALIECWRQAWKRPELPFLFVQLPGFVAQKAPPNAMDMDPDTLAEYKELNDGKTFTEVREAQLMTWLSVPNTGMAITIDVGESYDIHPPNKEPVADRLLLQARDVAYHEKLVSSGPVPIKTVAKDGAFVVTFDHVGSGLIARGGELKGFEVAGSDLKFVPATATIQGNQVVVRSKEVPTPLHLRYAWDGNPVATLANKENLPATPFRYSDWQNSPQADKSSFDIPNGSFEEINAKGLPAWWTFAEGASLTSEKASDGKHGVVLPKPNKSALRINAFSRGTGAYWNCPPLERSALRPGSLISYSLDLAAVPAGNKGSLYANMCQDSSGSGYQAWGGLPVVSTKGGTFVTRTIVQRMTDSKLTSLASSASNVGARFINQSEAPDTSVMVDHFTPVRILRPILNLSSADPISFGVVAPGSTKTSAERTMQNGQQEEFTEISTDEDPGTKFSTILYGVASFKSDAALLQQKIMAPTDNVGAVLIGKDAGLFEFVSPHCGTTPQELKLVGEDGNGGLAGGSKPETETFAVRFNAPAKAGSYQCTLRIVTQAGNRGTLSQAGPGEPPANFYYVDIPVTARVAP
ncbi:hypothetical protein BH09VER1_BH09VER1_36410 [soil metagenome]